MSTWVNNLALNTEVIVTTDLPIADAGKYISIRGCISLGAICVPDGKFMQFSIRKDNNVLSLIVEQSYASAFSSGASVKVEFIYTS